eukprot:CAMPEP_0168509328 /NCGR_PEP_ID=MMETSP0405-20121227/703_1 /TAXON_ID=498012 /ORGANISM="Trichosphaerium sp, Strain Am-I-7 wt" /LENGTH=581 /DNA_ID=CAMNT_0008526751 /DNA_START=34 /DNA_END=1780 /DNA_ORIENTATION=-
MTEFMHDVGSLIWFNTPKLREIVILDAQWLANVMSSLISFKIKIDNRHASAYLEAVPCRDASKTTRALEMFEVIFPLKGDDDVSIVPCLLPEQPNLQCKEFSLLNTLEKNVVRYTRSYLVDFLPHGFFSRLTVRCMQIPDVVCHQSWSRGILFQMGEEYGIISIIPDGVDITIHEPVGHKPPSGGSLLARIIASMDAMYQIRHRMVRKLGVEYWDPETGARCAHRDVGLDAVVEAFVGGQDNIQVGDQEIPVKAIAPDIAFVHLPQVNELTSEERIGEGGFAVVYKGVMNGEKEVAIKQLKGDVDTEKFLEFAHEVSVMSMLDHPNLVKLYGVTFKPHFSMILEYIPNKSLHNHLNNKDLSDDDFTWYIRTRILIDIASGLNYLQTLKPPIIHRDLRSPNIFIQSLDAGAEILAKIGDFGLAQYTTIPLDEALKTFQCLAPEILASTRVKYDERADTYSFAILMWEVVSRDYPFGEHVEYLLRREEVLSPEQLADEDLLESLSKQGWILEGDTAVFEEWKMQEVKTAIITDNLRPTIPQTCPSEIETLIRECWVGEPEQRPLMSKVLEGLKAFKDTLSQEA